MVSVTNISSCQASSYYQKDNYYTKNEGQWYGKGAENLGLVGDLKHEDFIAIINGKAPDGSFEIAKGGESQDHRAGVDLTFSAPKSASILAMSDPRIAEAHDRAVKATLDWVEKNYAMARQTVDGETQRVQTDNLVIATFQHETSRELDPQLHTHALVMNMTQRPDGEWRALSNEEIYTNKMVIGQYYRNEFAVNLRELGYGIKFDNKGLFEIAGVDQKIIEDFSRRSEQIDKKVEELRQQFPNVNESKLKEMACLDSRERKKDVDMNAVRESWNRRLNELGYTKEQLLTQAQAAGKEQAIDMRTAHDYIKDSAKIVTEQESAFSKDELLKTAGKLSVGNARFSDLESAINDFTKNKEIIQLDHDIYTTKEMITIEKNIVSMVDQGKGTMQSIVTPDQIQVGIVKYETEKGFAMTAGQRQAAEHILSSKDAIIGVQGDAGTGKTTVLDFVRQEAERAGYEVRGFSFTGKASGEIEKASGIRSQTIDSFLQKEHGQEQDKETGKQLWVVDEASMLGSRKMHEFLAKAQEENAKVVLIGDTKQLQAVEAGRMFKELQAHGMATVKMSEVQRQKTEEYKAVVKDISEKRIDQAIQKMETQGRLHEIADRDARFEAIKNEYMKDPNRTVVVTALNRDRNELNRMIRSELKTQGKLLGQDYTFVVRESKGLQPIEKHFAQNYDVGDIVVANRAGILGRSGSEARVTDVDQRNHVITVQTRARDGIKTCQIDLKQNGQDLQVYREKEIRLAQGDRVVFGKNDRGLGVKNGQAGVVNEISSDGKVTVQMGKETRTFSLKSQYNYIDYGYALTSYKSQGQTVDRVVYHADARSVNFNEAYVAATRGRYDMQIYTNSKSDFVEGMKQEQSKTSTLDYRDNPKETKTEQAKNIAVQTRQPETRQQEKTRQTETIYNSYVSKFSSESVKRGRFDKVQLLQGNRNGGKWSVNYERRHGLVYEKRTRTWTGKTVIEKSNRNYKSRTEISKSFTPWSYTARTVSYDKKTGKLTMTEQRLTMSVWTGKLKPDGHAKVTQINTSKLKNEIKDKTVLKAIEKAEKTLKTKDFEKAVKAIEDYQKYQARQAVLTAALTGGSVEIKHEKGYDKTEKQGQEKESVLVSGRGR